MWDINGHYFSSFLWLFFFKPWIDGTENKLVTRTRMLATASLNLIDTRTLNHCPHSLVLPGQARRLQGSTMEEACGDTSRETTHHHQSTRNIPDH